MAPQLALDSSADIATATSVTFTQATTLASNFGIDPFATTVATTDAGSQADPSGSSSPSSKPQTGNVGIAIAIAVCVSVLVLTSTLVVFCIYRRRTRRKLLYQKHHHTAHHHHQYNHSTSTTSSNRSWPTNAQQKAYEDNPSRIMTHTTQNHQRNQSQSMMAEKLKHGPLPPTKDAWSSRPRGLSEPKQALAAGKKEQGQTMKSGWY